MQFLSTPLIRQLFLLFLRILFPALEDVNRMRRGISQELQMFERSR
jgi:hypothetical protein